MDRIVFGVMTLAMQWLNPRFNARMQFLEAQIRILRSRVEASRIVPTPKERAELLRLGALMDHEIEGLMHVVVPGTYKKWLREVRGHRPIKPSGRPRTPFATRALIVRFAGENFQWGFRRIFGELKKLGIRISTTTIRNVLKEEGLFPEPGKAAKNPPIPWTTFVHANMESMIGCDFFTKRILTLKGMRDAYVLVFIHLSSRKVFYSPSTYHPDTAWMTQQARNASMWMDDEGIKPKYLIRDRDKKYAEVFDAFWKNVGIRPIKIPPRAPKANAFVETYIGKMKQELLNHFICFGLDQLDYINRVWLKHYHEQRSHRGIGRDNTVLDETFVPRSEGVVRCKSEFGGILKSYYREAA